MPFFAYTARNDRGDLSQGVIESSDSGAVADQLLGSGMIPVEIAVTQAAASKDANSGVQTPGSGLDS